GPGGELIGAPGGVELTVGSQPSRRSLVVRGQALEQRRGPRAPTGRGLGGDQLGTGGDDGGHAGREPTTGRAGAGCSSPKAESSTGTGLEPRLVDPRLEELDRIPGRVFDEDLPAADAVDDVVAEARARGAQLRHQRLDVLHFELKAVPATRLGHRPV